jgi:hypothetical protein
MVAEFWCSVFGREGTEIFVTQKRIVILARARAANEKDRHIKTSTTL